MSPADPRAPTPSVPELPDERYRPLSARRRWLVLLLAVATAVAVMLTLLDPPGGVVRRKAETTAAPATARPCAPGQSQDCLGGKVDVLPLHSTTSTGSPPASSSTP